MPDNTSQQRGLASAAVGEHEPPAGGGCRLIAYRIHEYDSFLRMVPAPADRFWMDFSTKGWANRCLPLRIANQAGWHILSDCDFEATWTGKPQVDSVKIRFADGRPSRLVKSNFGYGIVTWYLPYLFRTSPGYNLLVRGPANLPKDGIAPVEGLVETDWTDATFTVNWKFTRPFKPVKFSKDEPICLLLPQRRGELEAVEPEIRNIESDPPLQQRYTRWIESRRAWVDEASKTPLAKGELPSWQGHYTRGTHVTGEAAPEHQTKLELRPFLEREPPLRQPAVVEPVATGGRWNRLLQWARGPAR